MTQSRLRITRLAVKYRLIVNLLFLPLIKNHSHPNILEMVQLAPPPPRLHPFVSPILERMILRYKIYDRRR